VEIRCSSSIGPGADPFVSTKRGLVTTTAEPHGETFRYQFFIRRLQIVPWANVFAPRLLVSVGDRIEKPIADLPIRDDRSSFAFVGWQQCLSGKQTMSARGPKVSTEPIQIGRHLGLFVAVLENILCSTPVASCIVDQDRKCREICVAKKHKNRIVLPCAGTSNRTKPNPSGVR